LTNVPMTYVYSGTKDQVFYFRLTCWGSNANGITAYGGNFGDPICTLTTLIIPR